MLYLCRCSKKSAHQQQSTQVWFTGLAYSLTKAAAVFDPMGHQALQIGLQTLCQTTNVLKVVHALDERVQSLSSEAVNLGQQVQTKAAVTRTAVADLLNRQGMHVSKAFEDQLSVLKLIQSGQQSQAMQANSIVYVTFQLIAQVDRNIQYAFAENKRQNLEVALSLVCACLQDLRRVVLMPGILSKLPYLCVVSLSELSVGYVSLVADVHA